MTIEALEIVRYEATIFTIARRENVTGLGNSGTSKPRSAQGLGLAACEKGTPVGFTAAAALVNELHEARDEKRLLRLQRQIAGYKLPISTSWDISRSHRPAPNCCSKNLQPAL